MRLVSERAEAGPLGFGADLAERAILNEVQRVLALFAGRRSCPSRPSCVEAERYPNRE